MITLRPYQQRAVDEIRRRLIKNRVVFQLPTGGGKTIVFSYIAQRAAEKQSRILIISHRIELLLQSHGALQEFNVAPSLVTAQTQTPPESSISVAMVGTLRNRLKKPLWGNWFSLVNLLIIDECHRSEFNYLTAPHCFKLGVTATPRRVGKMPQLADEYDCIVAGPDTEELIRDNYLVYDKYFGVPVDIRGVGRDAKGEYKTSELFERYDKKILYKGLIDNWSRICPGTITLCFCCNIQHAIETTKSLNEADIEARFIVSGVARPKTPQTDNKASWTLYNRKLREYENYKTYYPQYSGNRHEIINQWKKGEFFVLVNASIFTEGFDHRPIQTIILNLSTTSENKYLQMLGRGSRTYPGKKYFNILDFGENAKRMGYYRQQREYSLHHSEGRGDGVPPCKECRQCGALVLASSRVCKYCGFEFPLTMREKVAELVEIPYNEVPVKKMSVVELEEFARQKGYKKAWVWRQIYFTHSEDELKRYARQKGYHYSWAARIIKQYKKQKV